MPREKASQVISYPIVTSPVPAGRGSAESEMESDAAQVNKAELAALIRAIIKEITYTCSSDARLNVFWYRLLL